MKSSISGVIETLAPVSIIKATVDGRNVVGKLAVVVVVSATCWVVEKFPSTFTASSGL
jgi:hypothetical protein